MKFNNILTALCCLGFSSLLLFAIALGHDKRVIQSIQDERGLYSVIVVEGTDTLAYDYMSYADLEYLERTGSLR